MGIFKGSYGDDAELNGSTISDLIYGDSSELVTFNAGDDAIVGNGGSDLIYGDADLLAAGGRGGNDAIDGGDGGDVIYGDAETLYGRSQGGDDELHGGAGNDVLWGDGYLAEQSSGGVDRFVFEGDFGQDRVMDFRGADDGDQILFKGLTADDITISSAEGDTVITTTGGDQVILVGVDQVHPGDILFG
jgi:Ca2+-binding RTX toxin-like protein